MDEGTSRRDEGYIMIAGDFNFVTNKKLDKKRERNDSGTLGSAEQKMGARLQSSRRLTKTTS